MHKHPQATRWELGRRWCAVAALLLGVACQPSGAGLVLEVGQIPGTAQALSVTVYVGEQPISQHTFDSDIAGQSSIELGYRIPEDKLGVELRFVVEAQAGSCRLAQGSTRYTASAPERFTVAIALAAPTPLASASMQPTLTAVHGSSDSNVWAVSADGRLVRWDGCGWSIASGISSKQLNAVHVVGADEVWAVGESAAILHYSAGELKAVPAVLDGGPVLGAYKGVWQAAPNDVWLVGSNADMNLCLLHHFDGSRLQDFSSLCATALGTPKVVDLTAIWGSATADGATLFAGGERSPNVVAGGGSAAALLVKKGSGSWQPVALDSAIATKAERVSSLLGLSPDEVLLGVNYGTLIHWRSADFPAGRELVVDAGRSPTLDDTIVAITGDSARNLSLLYAAGTGFSIYRSRAAVAPWSDASSEVGSILPRTRSLFASGPGRLFLVGASGLAAQHLFP